IFYITQQACSVLVGYFLHEIETISYRRREAKARYSFSHGSHGTWKCTTRERQGRLVAVSGKLLQKSSLVQQYCPNSAPFPEMAKVLFLVHRLYRQTPLPQLSSQACFLCCFSASTLYRRLKVVLPLHQMWMRSAAGL